MPWRFSDDVEAYAERALPLLCADPVEHTVALTVIDTLRAGQAWSDEPPVLGWLEEEGEIRGAVCRTPPFDLLLAEVPAPAALAAALREAGVEVPGVTGDVETVERFAAAWTGGTGLTTETVLGLRLFALGTLDPPDPPPPGGPRPADASELAFAMRWFAAFEEELALPASEREERARVQIEERRLWLWERDGEVVAAAGRSPASFGVSRISYVYTPREHRGNGYAGAVTAALSADALARDAERVVLFTDVDDPGPNKVYQRIGFRPVSDHRRVVFR
jgi:RimJ/RimL family protein N-acetyltransferase